MQYDELLLEEEEYESPLLGTMRNANIANFIIHEACKKYYNLIKNKWLPLSFIDFYFEEYKRYSFMSKNFLEPFFMVYQEIDTLSLVENYYHCQYSAISGKRKIKSEQHYLVEDNYYLSCNIADNDILGMFDPLLYQDLGQVSKHLENSDELVSIQDNYEYFLLKRYVLDEDRKVELKKAQKKAILEAKKELEEDKSPILVGAQTEVPNQKGKVVKVFFHKLNLPSPYPILNEKSRINSDHKAKNVLRADRQIKLINKYKINGVKYSVSFIEKRKAAKKPARRKFDFDF